MLLTSLRYWRFGFLQKYLQNSEFCEKLARIEWFADTYSLASQVSGASFH